MATKTRTPDVDIRRHPRYPETHARVIITVRGRCWFADWADDGEGITSAQALDAWRSDRQSFAPYYGY